MPLKVIRRPGTATLYISGTVAGARVRESTGTSNPKQAEQYRAKREAEVWQRAVYGARAVVSFAEATRSYLEAEPRTDSTKDYVTRLLKHFGTIPLGQIDQEAVDAAYKALLRPGVSNATKLRGVLVPLRAIMEHAAVRKWCDRPAFKAPKQAKTTTEFLTPAQATALVQHAADHLKPLLTFLLGTGCRLSEALELDWGSVDLRGARAVVWQKQGDQRRLDLPPVVMAALRELPHRKGRVFRPPGRMIRGVLHLPLAYRENGRAGGGQIKKAWATACRKAGLPGHWITWIPAGAEKEKRAWSSDVTPHDLRHSWASWHYAVHRDLLRLKADGGWGTVSMVERYAHLMPAAYAAEAAAWWATGTNLTQPGAED